MGLGKWLQGLMEQSIDDQLAYDQDLHRQAIKDGRFSEEGNQLLIMDIGDKQHIRDYLSGKIERNEANKQRVLNTLERDIMTHQGYLNRPSDPGYTGNYQWHRNWIDFYQKVKGKI